MVFQKLPLLLFAATALATQVMHRPDGYKEAAHKYDMEASPRVRTITRRTQVMHRPDAYKEPENKFATEANPKVNAITKRATGKTNFAYFTNWGIYDAYNFRTHSWLLLTALR